MATDDERREVARSLREIPDSMTYSADRIGKTVLEMFSPNGVFHGNGRKAFNRLADLIDPPRQCPYYDSGRHWCSIHDVPAIDRDALIELAEGLECKADDIIRAAKHAQFSGFGPSMGEAEHDAYEWRCIAHRIREALGVDDGR